MPESKTGRCINCIHYCVCSNNRGYDEDQYNDCPMFLHDDEVIHRSILAETLVEVETELHRRLPHKPLSSSSCDEYTSNSFELGREKALHEAIGLLNVIWRKHLGGTNNES